MTFDSKTAFDWLRRRPAAVLAVGVVVLAALYLLIFGWRWPADSGTQAQAPPPRCFWCRCRR